MGLMMKNKKIKYQDVGEFIRGERDDIVEKEFQTTGVRPLFGRSYINADCPFCKFRNRVYLWSFAGSGKRCEFCGAVFAHGNKAYQYKSEVGK